MSADTEAPLATVRGAQAWAVTLRASGGIDITDEARLRIADLLDSLAAELAEQRNALAHYEGHVRVAEAELERLRREMQALDGESVRLNRENRKALAALRNLQEAANDQLNAAEGRLGWMSADWVKDRCYWAIAEIEGEA